MKKHLLKTISFVLAIIMTITAMPLTAIQVSAANNFHITSHEDGETVSSGWITFEWSTYSGAHHYWLTVVNMDNGTKIQNSAIYDTEYRMILSDEDTEYKVYAAAMDANGDELDNGSAWEVIYIYTTSNSIEVSDDYFEFSANGGEDTFDIEAGSSWTISESLSWITVSPINGSSDKTITITCSKNTSSSDREGTITVKQTSTGKTFEIEVYQEGAEPEKEPEVTDLSVPKTTVMVGEEFVITIKTNLDAEGVALYVKDTNGDAFYIGSVETVSSKTSTTKTFKFDYYFNKTNKTDSSGKDISNTRKLYAYPIDSDGDEVLDDSVCDYVSMTVNPAEATFFDFEVDTPVKVTLGNSAVISWEKAVSSIGATPTYNVYIDDKYYDSTTSTSYTLPASYITNLGVGDYGITIQATATGHRAKQSSNHGALVIEELEKEPEVIDLSVPKTTVMVGEEFVITIKTNLDAEGVALYVKDTNGDTFYIGSVETVSSQTSTTKTFKFDYYFNKTNKTDSLGKDISNTRKLYAYPIDSDGDEVLDDSVCDYVSMTVNPAEATFSDFEVDTPVKVTLGNSAVISWEKAVSSIGATPTYNVYIDDKYYDSTTSTSYTLPASYITNLGVGDYGITIQATATGHRAKQSSNHGALVIEGSPEPSDLTIDSIAPSVTTANTNVGVTFTIKTNSATKYGVDLYANNYYLGRVTSKTTSGSTVTYKYTHKFTSAGIKTVTAYPVLEDGSCDKSVSKSCEVTINAPNGMIGNPDFTTADNTTIVNGNSFSVAWNAPSAPSSGITYNVYLWKTGTDDNVLVYSGTSRSCTISSSKFNGIGKYVITVYAVATGYTQNKTGATLTVNVKNSTDMYITSVVPSATTVPTLTDVDFTIKTSTSAKYGVAIYAGKYHLATIKTKKSSTSSYILYSYENHQFTSNGIKNIYVYPLDSSGKPDMTTFGTCDIEVTGQGVCSEPKITTSNNSVYPSNTSFTFEWKAPSTPSSGCVYNIYVRRILDENGAAVNETDTLVVERYKGTLATIGSNHFPDNGKYRITLYALAPGYSQSKGVAIDVYISSGYMLQVNASNLTAYEGGGNGSNITITSNTSWKITSNVSWITFSKTSGYGNAQFYPIIAANTSVDAREGVITVTGGGITRTIKVSQGGIIIPPTPPQPTQPTVSTIRVEVYVQKSEGSSDYVLANGAKVVYGGTTVTTDSNGIVSIKYTAGSSMTISKSGYSPQTIADAQIAKSGNSMKIKLKLAPKDGKPIINAVWVGNTNILTSQISVELLSQNNITFNADIDWGTSSYGSVVLFQNGKSVKFTNNNLTTVLSKNFDVRETIYIVAINTDGKETREELKIKDKGFYEEKFSNYGLSVTDGISIQLSDDAWILSGCEFNLSLDGLSQSPINISVEGNKFSALIGIDLVGYSNKDHWVSSTQINATAHRLDHGIKTVKDIYKSTASALSQGINTDVGKAFDKLKKEFQHGMKYPSGSFGWDATIGVAGYIEGYINQDGTLSIIDSGIMINPKVKWGTEGTVMVGPVPVVWEVDLKANCIGTLHLSVNEKSKGFEPSGNVDATFSVAVGAGVGVGGVASVTGGFEGEIGAHVQFNADKSVYANGKFTLNGYFKVKVALFEETWKKKFWETQIFEYPSPGKALTLAYEQELLKILDYTESYSLQSRDYLNSASSFSINNPMMAMPLKYTGLFSTVSTDTVSIFRENIYSGADAVIGEFEDGTLIAVYIDDDTKRSDINRTCLYYSFYNGIEWSKPERLVNNDGTADFSPVLLISQNKAFIAWQNATRVFKNDETLSIISSDFDIAVAEFDPKTKTAVSHTIEYIGLDMTPTLCAENGKVSVVWTNNASNEWFGRTNDNSILSYTYENGNWGSVKTVKTGLNSVGFVDAQYDNHQLYIAYTIDADNNLLTNDDVKIFLNHNGVDSQIDKIGSNYDIMLHNGSIYWKKNGNIMYCNLNNTSNIKSVFASDMHLINEYEVIENETGKYIVFIKGAGLYSTLCMSIYDYDTDTWSNEIEISDGQDLISDISSLVTDDGKIKVMATRTKVVGNMESENPYGLSDVVLYNLMMNGDLTVNGASIHNANITENATTEIYVDVKNTGKRPIKGVTITVYDADGEVLSTSIDETIIGLNEEKTLVAYMNMSADLIGTDITVVATPIGVYDENTFDNLATVSLVYYDVAVEDMEYGKNANGDIVIYANIANNGFRTENSIIVSLRKDSIDGKIVASKTIASLNSMSKTPVSFAGNFIEDTVYYIVIQENKDDMSLSNNSDYVVIHFDDDPNDEPDDDEYFIYTKLADGTYSIKLKDKTNAPANLVIPSTYNGAKVSTIASKGFKDCTKIVNVEISEGITIIDTYAFYGCTSLETITIPSTVSSIENYSFYGCKALKKIVYNGTELQWNALINDVLGMPNVTVEVKPIPVEDYLTFTKLSDGTYSVKLTDKTNAPTNLVIPSTYNGAKVSTIASKGFKDCTKIVNVEIPEGIELVASYAFYGCTSLKTVTLSSTVGSIEDYAFYGCKALQQITYHGTAEWWSIISNHAQGMPSNVMMNYTRTTTPDAYFNFTALSNGTYSVTVKNKTEIPANVVIPSVYNGVRIATIGRSAFKDSLVVESITIPRGISSIDIYAFYGCKNLKTIYIPNTVKSIADYIFYNCTSLTVIYEGTAEEWQRLIAGKAGMPSGLNVICTKKPTDNSYFSFTKLTDGTYSVKLADVANAPTHIVIPSVYNGARVTEIARSGFKDCTKLVSVEIPEGIQKISLYAFYGCSSLQTVKIPSTVKTIENYVFYNDKQLQTIIYNGTVSQWEALAGAVAGMPSNVQIRCAENTIIDTYFVYTMLADGTYSIKARDKNNLSATLKIPVSGNGIKVSAIASKGFKDCTKLVSVEIPEGITTLDTYAFYGCSNLTTITIPSTVSSIGNYSFYGCTTKIIYNGTKAQWASLISGVLGMTAGLEVECIKEPIPEPDPYFTFTKLSNGTYSVKLTNKENAPADLVIPSTYDGAKVTMIESKGFKDCTKIVSVVIPEGITTIDIYGFYGCKNLKTITIPSTVSSIGHYTFYGTGLGKVVYNGTENQWAAIIGNVKGTPTGIEVECKKEPIPGPEDYFTFIKLPDGTYSVKLTDKTNVLANLVIPSTYNGAKVSTIATKGFKDCTKLVSIEIPEGVTTLDTYAFYGCSNLTTITIPSTVSSIGNYSFYGCTTKIIYNGTKAQWASLISGVLGMPAGLEVECIKEPIPEPDPYFTFTKLSNGTYSVKLTNKENAPADLVIPSTYNGAKVSTIATKGFKDCTKLVSVVVPEGITTLDTYAFYGCTTLKTITIPSTVSSIGNYSFYGCTTKIVYNGTKAQWASLISGVLGMPAGLEVEYQKEPIIDPEPEPDPYFTFTKLSNGTYSVKLTDKTNAPADLVIPSTYDGAKVTMIESKGFKDCTKIVSVEIPEGITTIDIYGFYGCKNLKTITIPSTVSSIGHYTFYGTGLGKVVYNGTKNQWEAIIGNVKGTPADIEVECQPEPTSNLFTFIKLSNGMYSVRLTDKTNASADLVIPSTYNGVKVSTIASKGFKDCAKIVSVEIPEGITTLDTYTFYNCTNLKTITIPSTVSSIGNYSFYGCTTKIIYNGTKAQWASLISGVLGMPAGLEVECCADAEPYLTFTKLADGTYSVKITDKTNVPEKLVIPSTYNGAKVSTIASKGFKDCPKLVSVVIPEGITMLDMYAFYGCTKLKTMIIPSTVNSIGNYSFYGCKALEKIVYYATESQWNALIKNVSGTPACEIFCLMKDSTHNLLMTKQIQATCTKDGNIDYWTCVDCGKIFKDSLGTNEIGAQEVIIKSIEHSYVNDVCKNCGHEKENPLEVTSVYVDKTFLAANEQVTFGAVTNKSSNDITLTVNIYLDGTMIAKISGKGIAKYTPVVAGRYDAEVLVTDGKNTVTRYLKSCFDVKKSWSLERITANANTAYLGNLLTFTAEIDGDASDLDYNITIYKDGASYNFIEGTHKVEFYPNTQGTYYAVIVVTDIYGESQTAQSSNVIVKTQSVTNPTFSVNYGTTLDIDELNGKDGEDIIVPAGKNINLVWSKPSTYSYCRLRIRPIDNDLDEYGVNQSKYTTNTYLINSNSLVPGHRYNVTVRKYDSSGTQIGASEIEFTVGGANSIMLEKELEIRSIVHDGVYAYDDLNVSWTKLNYATKYELALEYHCGSAYHDVYESIFVDGTKQSYTIPKSDLHIGCTHRLYVYAYDALGNKTEERVVFDIQGDKDLYEIHSPEITSEYFYTTKLNIKSYPIYEDIVVTWTEIPAASYYSITVDCVGGEGSDPILAGNTYIDTNSFSIPAKSLMGGCIYMIRVYAHHTESCKEASVRMYFKAPYPGNKTLDPPEIISHDLSKTKIDPTIMVEQSLTIVWKPVSAAVKYHVYWSEIGEEDSPDFEVENITSTTITIPVNDIYDCDSVLWIEAEDSNGNIATSQYYIRFVESSLETPMIISPTLATDDEGELPSFDEDFTIYWNIVEGAVSYKVRVWECYDDELYELFAQDEITDTSFEIPLDELYFGGVFRVSIRANDQYGGCSKSSKYYFQVGESDYIDLSIENWTPSYKTDYKYLNINTVGNWTAQVSAPWITLDSTSGGGSARLKVSVTENTDNFARTGTITFKNDDGGIAVLSVTQAANGSSNTGVVQITSPVQGSTLEKDMITARWTCKYGWHYFGLTLKDLTDGDIVYSADNITIKYAQIPARYIQSGHTYQLTIAQYYDNVKSSESSVVFKVEGNNGSFDEEEEIKPTTPSLEYISNGDGTCYVSGIGTYTDTKLVIPSISPLGDRVVGIGESAFNGNHTITQAYISEGITSIEKSAFTNCTKLKTVDLPSSLTSIGNEAFWGCTALTEITIPEKINAIGYAVFSHCSALKEVRLCNALKKLDEYAFYLCTSLNNITFEGTQAQWNAISKASTWNQDCPKFAVTCTDGSPSTQLSAPQFSSHTDGTQLLAGQALPVKWYSVNNAVNYTCVISRVDNGLKQLAMTVVTNPTMTITADQFQAGYWYQIAVKANGSQNGYEDSEWSFLYLYAFEKTKTANQKQVEQFIAKLNANKYLTTKQSEWIHEYYIADKYHIRESTDYDIGDMARHTLLGGDIIGGAWKWIWDSDAYEVENMVYPFLYTVIGNMPELSQNDSQIKNMKFPEQTSKVWSEVSEFTDFVDSIGDPLEKIGEVVDGGENILGFVDELEISEELLSVVGFIEDYLRYRKFATAAQVEYFDILLESIANTPENENLRYAIKLMRSEYLNQSSAVTNDILKFVRDKMLEEAGEITAKGLLSALGVACAGEVILVVEASDFVISFISDLTGGKDYVEALDNVAYYGYIPQAMKESLIQRLNEYDGSVESADMIVAHYNLWRSMQIFFNEATAKISDASSKRQLEKEIEHIKSSSMENWTFNPYTDFVKKPGISWADYYQQIFLLGDAWDTEANDGVMENWSSYTVYDRILVSAMVEKFRSFASSPIESIYFLKGTRYDTDISMTDIIKDGLSKLPAKLFWKILFDQFGFNLEDGKGYYRILFVNEAGEGLVLFRGYENDIIVETLYSLLTPTQTKMIICGSYNPETWFAIDNNGAHSIRSTPSGYMFATEEYIRMDITTQQYHDVLYDVTASKYCNKSMDKISLPRIVDERIYPELWVKSLTFKGMADEIKNAGKQVYYWNNEDGISPELLK